jgi:hypothetical protein
MEKHTSTFSQALDYVMECVRLSARHSPGGFFLTVIVAILLGGLCWYAATQYTKLWNLRYTPTLVAHVLCGIAAVLTMLFTIAFASLDYAKDIALDHVNRWNRAINRDDKFLNDTYVGVYYAVKGQGVEHFDQRNPPPNDPHSTIPMNSQQTRVFVGKFYADAAVTHFRKTNPLLSRMIWPGNASVPVEVIHQDMNNFFNTHHDPKDHYNLNHGVDIAADLFRKNLVTQTPEVVTKTRWRISLLFILVQLIPFGLIGYAAYEDLKYTT